MTYTTAQLELKAHIEAENKEFEAHCKANNAQWWTTTTTDLDHWAEMGVTTIAEYIRCNLESEYSDVHKEAFNFRPRNYSHLSNEELQECIDRAVNSIRAEAEWEQEQERKAQEAHEERKKKNRYVPNNAFAGLKELMNGCS